MGKKDRVITSPWKIFKETGLCQFSLVLPSPSVKNEGPRLILEGIPPKNGGYDWSNEIAVGMDISEIGELIDGLESGLSTPVDVHHEISKRERTDKILIFSGYNDGIKLDFIVRIEGSEIRNVELYLNKTETLLFKLLLNSAVISMMGFLGKR